MCHHFLNEVNMFECMVHPKNLGWRAQISSPKICRSKEKQLLNLSVERERERASFVLLVAHRASMGCYS